jgi:hypothetical protein
MVNGKEVMTSFKGSIQWRNYSMARVEKCQGSWACGGPLGPPASELKTLKYVLLQI